MSRIVKENNIDNTDILKNKTNDELKNIMRDSIDNSYVPSSIYNKAKQELEFRNSKKSSSDIIVKIIIAVISSLIVAILVYCLGLN